MTIEELKALDKAGLEELIQQATDELNRRLTEERIPQQMEDLQKEFLTAKGRVPGQPYEQPAGAHDAYPLGWTVTEGGKTFKSIIPANVWAPSTYPRGWEEVKSQTAPVDPVTPPTTTPEWKTGVAYKTGDLVTFEGKTYSCVQAHTSQAGWTPVVVPALWKVV